MPQDASLSPNARRSHNLPVADVALFPAWLVAEPATLEAIDTALDVVALPPAAALDATIVALETAEAAVLSPPAAAVLAPDGQLAAEGSVIWTLKSLSATGPYHTNGSTSRVTQLDGELKSLCTTRSAPDNLMLADEELTRLVRLRACVFDAARDTRDPVVVRTYALNIQVTVGW